MPAPASPDFAALLFAIDQAGIGLRGLYAVGPAAYVALVEDRPDDATVARVGSLHADLRAHGVQLDGAWAVRSDLTSPMALGRRWWTVDAGRDTPRESSATNTSLRRWVLREQGVALLGPPATEVVAGVTTAVIATESLGVARTHGETIEADPAVLADEDRRRALVDELVVAVHASSTGQVVDADEAREWCRDRLPEQAGALERHPGGDDVRRFVWEAHARIGMVVASIAAG